LADSRHSKWILIKISKENYNLTKDYKVNNIIQSFINYLGLVDFEWQSINVFGEKIEIFFSLIFLYDLISSNLFFNILVASYLEGLTLIIFLSMK
jgi:hypothetical protein